MEKEFLEILDEGKYRGNILILPKIHAMWLSPLNPQSAQGNAIWQAKVSNNYQVFVSLSHLFVNMAIRCNLIQLFTLQYIHLFVLFIYLHVC